MGEAFSKVESSLTGRRWVGLPNETLRQGLAISQALQIPEIVSRTIAAQGVTVEEAKSFLDSKIKYLLPDPKSFKDVENAAKRLISAIWVPLPAAMRCLREPFRRSGKRRSRTVMESIITPIRLN